MASVIVMVVDSNAEVRRMIRWIVNDLVETVHERATPAEALDDYCTLGPDIVVMDLSTPPCDGLWATRQITNLDPDAIVLIVTHYPDPALRDKARDAGASGCVLKDNLIELRWWLSPATASSA